MPGRSIKKQIDTLWHSKKLKFSEWNEVKNQIQFNVSGVYVIWKETDLIYAGMASVKNNKGDSTKMASKQNPKGLLRRLGRHASGNRGGNMFCVYVGDRFIVPNLSEEELKELEQGKLKLDGQNGRIGNYIRDNFTFQYIITVNEKVAKELEYAIRKGDTRLGRPILNPSLS